LVKYSRQEFKLIQYSPLSFYYPRYKGSGFLLRHEIPHTDPYGYYLAKILLPKYDIVHTHGHPHWFDVYKKPQNSKAKYIHTVHQIYYKEDATDPKRWKTEEILNRRLVEYCSQADLVISVSKWLQQQLNDMKIDSIYIPHGIDVERCEKANPSNFRKKYQIKDDFFLFIGNNSRLKRANLFIKLADMMPERLFIMCGVGLSDQKRNLISLGHLNYSDVLDAIAASKVLIVPSSKETFSSVILEGVACNKPIVATNSSGMKEILNFDKDRLFSLDNISELKEKASKAWENGNINLREYKLIKEKFDFKNIAKETDKIYEGLI
jgi:glycosyltransferase involved in cell wall biosynthesis